MRVRPAVFQAMTSPADTKSALRARLRAELKALSTEARVAASTELCARVKSSAAWQSARALLLFFPVPSEPDISPLLADLLAAGKLLALPRFNAATQAYEAVRVLDLARELAEGPFKVREIGRAHV